VPPSKTARLDQILLQLGYVHVDEITRALRRQQSHGGRLGMNLVQLGAITEEQLLIALTEQFRMPAVKPTEADVPKELLDRMPHDLLAMGLVIPLAWNETQRVLSIATSNPGDDDALAKVRSAFDARGMRVGIAPEGLMAALGRRLAPGGAAEPGHADGTSGRRGRIQLPELFADAHGPGEREPEGPMAVAERPAHAVMVTSLTSRKDFLPSVFDREGVELTVVADEVSLRKALALEPTHILVSGEMASEVSCWRENGLVFKDVAVVRFDSVSASLLDNPLGYADVVRSLKHAVQALADYRSGELGVSPPYGLIAADVRSLAEAVGLGTVARDGLDLCAHLLLPHPDAARDGAGLRSPEPFAAFASTLELATRLRFPWAIDRVLAACHRLYRSADGADVSDGDPEITRAAQVLALVWHRHVYIDEVPESTDEDRLLALRSAIRSEGLRLASTPVVEAYVNLIATRGGAWQDRGQGQVLLVGGERVGRALAPALARVGRESLVSNGLADAQTVVQRREPTAILIDREVLEDGVDRFIRVAKLGADPLVFVLTDSTDPALVLNLLDVGADDVFGPPHDFDLVAARVNRAIRSRSRTRRARGSGDDHPGSFSARFDVFSLLDLLQMLSQGMKTVQIDLSREQEAAVLYMRKGRIVHATLGGIVGERAVYRVLAWEDDGAFTVAETKEIPDATIDASTESLLMEGLRLLDESRR